MQGEALFPRLLRRFPRMRLAGPPVYRAPGSTLRGLESLPAWSRTSADGRGHPVHDGGQQLAAGADGDPDEAVARRAEVQTAAERHPAAVEEQLRGLRTRGVEAEPGAVEPGQVARLRRDVANPRQPLAQL